ncbi:MAG TPA: ChaN family lipoprotein [Polyangiaceae bacterium]|jgi:uncharacterized iron-regulated protein
MRASAQRVLVAALLGATMLDAGCTARRPAAQAPGLSRGASETAEPPRQDRPHPAHSVPDDIVERAALPFHGLRLRDQQPLSPEELMSELGRAHLICFGEQHDNPHDHYAQWTTVNELSLRAKMAGRELGIGMEMFEARFQRQLDAYLVGKTDAAQLMEQTKYAERWGFPFAYYRPALDVAKTHGLPVLALGLSQETAERAAKQGVESLSREERAGIQDFDFQDAEHRALFDQQMKDHPKSAGSLDHLYAVQVMRDEVMARTAGKWLADRHPARLLLVLAGNTHCHRSGIVRRVRRRMELKAVGVRPVVESNGADQADLQGYDYAFVMSALKPASP